jgi:hypothetical protein
MIPSVIVNDARTKAMLETDKKLKRMPKMLADSCIAQRFTGLLKIFVGQ